MLERVSTPLHGMYFHEEPGPRGIGWWQYWTGVEHIWYWGAVPVWRRLRKRKRPMHELTRRICGA